MVSFEKWWTDLLEIPFQCSVDLLESGKACSTIKMYLAISAWHVGFEGKTVGQQPLDMRGACHSLPVSKPLDPPSDPTHHAGCSCQSSF